jgi:hypothetical protein
LELFLIGSQTGRRFALALDVTNLASFRHWVLLSQAKNLSGEANRRSIAGPVAMPARRAAAIIACLDDADAARH